MITVLVGAPGAGKSTWVKKHRLDEYVFNTEGVRIDRDIDVGAYMHNQRRKAIKAVEAGQSLIADGTHTMTSHRRVWLALSKRLGLQTKIVIFNTPLDICLAVQKEREYPAPNKIVRQHCHKLRWAMVEIQSEGWGSVEIIKR